MLPPPAINTLRRHHTQLYILHLAKHHFDLVILLQFFLCQLPLAGPVEAVTRCTYQVAAGFFAQSCFVWCYPCPFNLTIIQSEEESCTVRDSVLVLHLVHQREVKYNQILPYTSLASAPTVPAAPGRVQHSTQSNRLAKLQPVIQCAHGSQSQ